MAHLQRGIIILTSTGAPALSTDQYPKAKVITFSPFTRTEINQLVDIYLIKLSERRYANGEHTVVDNQRASTYVKVELRFADRIPARIKEMIWKDGGKEASVIGARIVLPYIREIQSQIDVFVWENKLSNGTVLEVDFENDEEKVRIKVSD